MEGQKGEHHTGGNTMEQDKSFNNKRRAKPHTFLPNENIKSLELEGNSETKNRGRRLGRVEGGVE
jgi:hypothetical protein